MAKHPVPKKKTSKARGSRRYKSFQNRARRRLNDAIQLTSCKNCQAVIRMHHVCQECGYYRGQDILGTAPEPEEQITTIKAD